VTSTSIKKDVDKRGCMSCGWLPRNPWVILAYFELA
jgi:hypothetical protein